MDDQGNPWDNSLYEEFENIPTEDLSELHAEVYDRWNFETGSQEDLELMKKLENEIEHRRFVFHFTDETVKAMAEEIRNEIDKSILDTLSYGDIEDERANMVSNQE